MRYIPGAVLRGAVAEILLARCADEKHIKDHNNCPVRGDCDFYHLFGGPEQIIFENAYPAKYKCSHSFPLPKTARSCKQHRGFLNPDKPYQHGIRDTLIKQYAWEEAYLPAIGDTGVPPVVPYLEEFRCPTCDGEQDVLPESYRFYARLEEGPYQTVKVPVQRTSRVAINRRTATAEEGLLYTIETISEDQVFFKGIVTADERQKTLLHDTLEQVTTLGHGRSRGLGCVSVMAEESAEESSPTMEERLARFNALMGNEHAFHSRVKAALGQAEKISPNDYGEWFFTVDLLSDAIPTRDDLPVARLEPEIVARILEVDSKSISLARAWASQHVVSGRLAAGLPRGTQLAIAMGSVFLYKVQGIPRGELLPKLQLIEKQGIGRGRERGYGRVLVCAPFHLEVNEV